MRTRTPGIMGIMFLLGATLLVAGAPAVAEGEPGPEVEVAEPAVEQQAPTGGSTDGGQTDGKTDGETDSATDGAADSATDGGQTDGGQTDGKTDGETDSATDGAADGATDGGQADGLADGTADGGSDEEPEDQQLAICHFDDGDPFDSWQVVIIPGQEVDAFLAQYPDDFKLAHADCPVSEDVTICVPQGLNWKARSVHPQDANWMLANENATLPGPDGGCLVRVCVLQEGEFFDVWNEVYGSLAEAEAWTAQHPQSFWPSHDKACPTNPEVTICHLLGLDYKAAVVDAAEAEWFLSLDSDDRLPSEHGCLVRLCHAEGQPYVEWQTQYLEAPAAEQLASDNELDFLGEEGVACPVSEPVEVCMPTAGGYELTVVDPLTANEMLGQQGALEPDDGACPVIEDETPTPTPEPEETPTPTPEPEETPTPEPEESPTPEPEESPTPEPEESPTPEQEPTPTPEPDDDTDASAPTPTTPTPESDGEVLGRSQRRELAETGTESSQLAMYGIALLVGGAMLVGVSRLRRLTN